MPDRPPPPTDAVVVGRLIREVRDEAAKLPTPADQAQVKQVLDAALQNGGAPDRAFLEKLLENVRAHVAAEQQRIQAAPPTNPDLPFEPPPAGRPQPQAAGA